MRSLVVSAIIALSVSNVGADDIVVDVKQIAGKNELEVTRYLGRPVSCEDSKHGIKCQYKRGETEVVFINKKADWITVEGIDHAPFSISTLSALGLQTIPPSFKSHFTLRWTMIEDLMEVSIFKRQTNSDYAYIKVRTK